MGAEDWAHGRTERKPSCIYKRGFKVEPGKLSNIPLALHLPIPHTQPFPYLPENHTPPSSSPSRNMWDGWRGRLGKGTSANCSGEHGKWGVRITCQSGRRLEQDDGLRFCFTCSLFLTSADARPLLMRPPSARPASPSVRERMV